MNTIKYLSKITGVSTHDIKSKLHLDITTPDDIDLSYNQINNLGQNLYHTPIDKLCSFLLIVDGIAYRGTMIGLICQNLIPCQRTEILQTFNESYEEPSIVCGIDVAALSQL